MEAFTGCYSQKGAIKTIAPYYPTPSKKAYFTWVYYF